MKSRDYEYVLAISQEGSFSRAAQRLYITQPALSSAIKKLETELYGVPLFDRSASPVKLTPEGQFWLEKARRISALDNEIDEHFSSVSGVLKGTISIGSSSFFCAYVLAEIIHRFQEKHPGCRIILTECSFTSMETGLRDGSLVLGIDVERPDPSVSDVTELGREYLILGVPSSFAVNEQLKPFALDREQILTRSFLDPSVPEVDLSLLSDAPFILMKRTQDGYGRAQAICRQAGFEPKVSLYMDQLLTAYNVARNGQSACVFFRDTILRYTEPTSRLKYYKLGSPLAERSIWLSVRKTPKLSRLTEDFIRFLMLSMKE